MIDIKVKDSSAAPTVAQGVAAVLLGLVALPILLGGRQGGGVTPGGAGRIEDYLWLAAGSVIAIWLLFIAPSLARDLAALLDRLIPDQGVRSPDASNGRVGVSGVAQWLVALGYVLVAQAVLRRPLVLTLNQSFDSITVEAIFAAFVMVLLIVVLLRLHLEARPLIERATWSMLDAFIATSGSERTASAAAVAGVTVAASTRAATPGESRPVVSVGTPAATILGPNAEPANAATTSAAPGEVTRAAPPESDMTRSTSADETMVDGDEHQPPSDRRTARADV